MFIITDQLKLKQDMRHIGGGEDMTHYRPSFDILGDVWDVSPLSPAGFTPLHLGRT